MRAAPREGGEGHAMRRGRGGLCRSRSVVELPKALQVSPCYINVETPRASFQENPMYMYVGHDERSGVSLTAPRVPGSQHASYRIVGVRENYEFLNSVKHKIRTQRTNV